MRSATKRNRRKSQREAARERRQRDPVPATEDEDLEVTFPHIQPVMESPLSSPPASPTSQGELHYCVVLTMVQKINNQLGDMNVDNAKIRSVCDGLLRDYQIRDEAITDLTRLVRETVDCPAPHHPHRDTAAPHQNNMAGVGDLATRRQGCRTTCRRTTATIPTGNVDTLHTGEGTCPLSHVNTTTNTAIVCGGPR